MTTDPTSGPNDLTQRFALDVQGFDSLRAKVAASPQQGVKMAAKQFDASFITMTSRWRSRCRPRVSAWPMPCSSS
jgi:flagellar protein FlgJ